MQLRINTTCKRCNVEGSCVSLTKYNTAGEVTEEITEDPCTLCGGNGQEDIGYCDDEGVLEDILDKINDIEGKIDEIIE